MGAGVWVFCFLFLERWFKGYDGERLIFVIAIIVFKGVQWPRHLFFQVPVAICVNFSLKLGLQK